MFVSSFLHRCRPSPWSSSIRARLTRTQQWKTQILIRSISNKKQDTPAVSTIQVPNSWVEYLPAKARPYLYLTRVDKPIGTLLLFYPCGRYTLHGPMHTPFSSTTTSMVNNYGILCAAVALHGSSNIYQSLWVRCPRYAWSRLYDQRYVGQKS